MAHTSEKKAKKSVDAASDTDRAGAICPGRFQGRSVIVTGAASGLGKAAAQRLAAEGANLMLVDLNEKALAGLQSQLKKTSDGTLAIQGADVSREKDVYAFVEAAAKKFGGIDGFFNNAGIEGKQNTTEKFGAKEFDKVVGVNLNGVFYGMAAVLEIMRKQGRGSIVNAASVGGIRGVGNQSGYAASKHGVVGLTRNSAVEYGQYGIQINAIAPGAIMTQMVEDSLRQSAGEDWEAAGKEFVSVNPMKRFGKPEEVAALVAFLLSGEAPFINGTVIPIDGGQSYKY